MKLSLELPPFPQPATRIINAAIEEVAQAGGGTVEIPPGTHCSGTIFLRSNTTLELSAGATLLASEDLGEYPALPLNAGLPEHLRKGANPVRRHLLVAEDAENVTLCGRGTIDGNVAAFAPGWTEREPYTWCSATERIFIPMVEFLNCRDVRIRDVTLQNSPGWTCHVCCCDRVRVEGVTLLNDLYAGNSDGFDVDGCRDVWFTDCRIETGDDCIVLKTNPLARSCERIFISRCLLRSTCAAVKIGTESWFDFRQIHFTNSIVHQSNRAFQISCFDGGTVEDVLVDGLIVDTDSANVFNRAIHLDLAQRHTGFIRGRESDRRLGRIRRVSISNLSIRTDGRLLFTAGDGGRLEDISLKDIRVHYVAIEDPALSVGTDPLQGSSSCPEAAGAAAAIIAENVDRLRMQGISIVWPSVAGEDVFRPKYQGGVVLEPGTRSDRGLPKLEAFWGKGLREAQLGGRISQLGED